MQLAAMQPLALESARSMLASVVYCAKEGRPGTLSAPGVVPAIQSTAAVDLAKYVETLVEAEMACQRGATAACTSEV